VNRRLFLQRTAAFAGCSAVGLTGCAKKPIAASVNNPPSLPFYDAVGPITCQFAPMWTGSFASPSALGRFAQQGRDWTLSDWATRWSFTTTDTAAAAGHSPGAQRMWSCLKRWMRPTERKIWL